MQSGVFKNIFLTYVVDIVCCYKGFFKSQFHKSHNIDCFRLKTINVLFLNEIKFLCMLLLVTWLVVYLIWFIHGQ